MKKRYLILSFVLMMLLTSCGIEELQSSGLVEAPTNNNPPLSGKWKVTGFIDGPYKREDLEVAEDISSMEGLFSKEAVIIGKDFTTSPSYKVRDIDINEYLFYNYKIDVEYLDIPDEDIYIITISGDDGYFHEFIKYDEEKIVFFYDERFIFFQRQAETVSEDEVMRYIDIEKSINISTNLETSYTINSGLLLGIKTKYTDEDSKIDNWEYNTIWIRSSNREIASIYKINGILLPRKRGFWEVDVKREKLNENIKDLIIAEQKGKFKEGDPSISISPIENFFSKNKAGEYLSLLRHILYIGNDYVSVEEINPATNIKNLRVYPIDYLEDQNPTMISNIINVEDFNLSAKTNLKLEGDILDERSFGIDRKNGHWMLKGRFNYIEEKEQLYKDFNIKSIPPREIVQYDELAIPWSLIKSRFPQAIDAFTSPNQDVILIVTRENIEIYAMRENDILQEKLGNIEIGTNQKIVMAEWGLGKYASLWEKEILKNDAIELEY